MGVTAARDVFGIEAFRWWVQMGFRERVSATQWTGSLPGRPTVLTTGADGRFKLSGVGRDRVIVVRLEGPAIASADLAVKTLVGDKFVLKTQSGEEVGELYGVSFDHPAAVSRPIRGVVRDQDTGRPLAGVVVGPPTDERFTNPLCKAVTDQKGRYELLGVPKSPTYRLRLKPPDGLYLQRSTQLKDPGGLDALVGSFELVQGGVTVRGKVTDKATGKPIAGAMVDYMPLYRNPYVDQKLSGAWSPRSEVITGPDGSYVLTVLPGPGVIGVIGTLGPDLERYMPAHVTREEMKRFFKSRAVEGLIADAGGNLAGGAGLPALYNAYVLLEPNENDKALVKDVALEAPHERKGRVVGPDGQPLAGVEFRGRKTSAGGEFTLRSLNPRQGLEVVF
jgi:hypothetical protein